VRWSNRHQQAVRLHQPGEDILENVLGIRGVWNTPEDEAAEPEPSLSTTSEIR
jgi:hypothetical protein